jgi:hypothetical protein
VKTPLICVAFAPIRVRPLEAARQLPRNAPLSSDEATRIVEGVRPHFRAYCDQYDTGKYWPQIYETVLEAFQQPRTVSADTLRQAILWKYGHLPKSRIPTAHEALIADLQARWPVLSRGLPATPDAAFARLYEAFGGATRYVTVAFLTHLLHPTTVPIIDQHNFRSTNVLIQAVRPSWRIKRLPSRYEDILVVDRFMRAVATLWAQWSPADAPSLRALDKFLMMYGKALKPRLRQS